MLILYSSVSLSSTGKSVRVGVRRNHLNAHRFGKLELLARVRLVAVEVNDAIPDQPNIVRFQFVLILGQDFRIVGHGEVRGERFQIAQSQLLRFGEHFLRLEVAQRIGLNTHAKGRVGVIAAGSGVVLRRLRPRILRLGR